MVITATTAQECAVRVADRRRENRQREEVPRIVCAPSTWARRHGFGLVFREGIHLKVWTLWHGTTKSAAERIAHQGFEPADIADIVGAVANDHGLAVEAVLDMMHAAGRFVVIQDRRNDATWFATSKDKAATWAQRAPEARWEALWAVWWLTHSGPELVPYPWLDPDAAGWHARQFFADPPAVIEVQVPIERLQDEHQAPLPTGMAAAQAWLDVPQISVAHPVPAEWIVGYEILPRHVEFTAAAGILRLDLDELGRRVDTGEIIPCRPPLQQYGHDWYWHLDEFLTLPPGTARLTDAS
jgi:hypothetical protein